MVHPANADLASKIPPPLSLLPPPLTRLIMSLTQPVSSFRAMCTAFSFFLINREVVGNAAYKELLTLC